jgi:hypothetical protein
MNLLTECLHLRCVEMSRDTIDEVVLVGGTTRIPKVKQQLRYTDCILNPFVLKLPVVGTLMPCVVQCVVP